MCPSGHEGYVTPCDWKAIRAAQWIGMGLFNDELRASGYVTPCDRKPVSCRPNARDPYIGKGLRSLWYVSSCDWGLLEGPVVIS